MNKTKTLITIPSLGRPQYIKKKTMAWLADTGLEFKIFVEPHESFIYKKEFGSNAIVTLPKKGQGLMYSLNYIRLYAKNHGYEFIFQLDDDVDGFETIEIQNPVEAFKKTIQDCTEAMETFPKLGGIRFTQFRYWLFSKKKMFKWTHYNRPLQGIAMIRLEAIPQIEPELKEFTDTITSLYIWRCGYFTLNYGLSGLKVVQNANKGGCQSYNRKIDAETTIKALQKDFPMVFEKEGSSWFGVDVDISKYMDMYKYAPLNMDDENLILYLE